MQKTGNSLPFTIWEKSEPWLFVLALCICLVPIWTVSWFASQDGPCHLHNSKVLLDFWQNRNLDFYSSAYETNSSLFPNWTNHFVYANLLRIFTPWLTEKVWLTAYVITFAVVHRAMAREINPKNTFLSFVYLPFMYVHPLHMGFYNFMLSIALLPGIILLWQKYSQKKTWKRGLILGIALLLLYFTHLVGLVLALVAMACFLFFQWLDSWIQQKIFFSEFKKFLFQTAMLLVISLPALILTWNFIGEGGVDSKNGDEPISILLWKFLNIETMVNYSQNEFLWTHFLAVLIAVLFLTAMVSRIRHRKFKPADGFLVIAILIFIAYLQQPGQVSGHGILPVRLQALPWVFIILWLSAAEFPKAIRVFSSFAALLVMLMLTLVRFPAQEKISNAFQEIVDAGKFIPERSHVLPISFHHNGIFDDGEMLSPVFWAFMHSSDVLGADKSLIMLSNYEASNGHFPVHYKENKNPYLIMNEKGGLEGQPPYSDFSKYEKETGISVDFILTWCMEQVNPENSIVQEMKNRIENNYDPVFTSSGKRVILFKKKPNL